MSRSACSDRACWAACRWRAGCRASHRGCSRGWPLPRLLEVGSFSPAFWVASSNFPLPRLCQSACRRSLVRLRSAVGFVRSVERAVQIALLGPLHVIRNDQVQLAVPVVVHPRRAGGKFIRVPTSRGLGHIGERPVTIVVKEMALSERGDEEIVVSVVVVVADRRAEAKHRNRQSGLARHVREGAVVIVVIELQRGRRASGCPGQSSPLTSTMSG